MRSVIGAIAGILIAGILIALIEAIGHGVSTAAGGFVAAILGYGTGCLFGSLVTTRLSGRRSALAVPAALALLAAINIATFPHPAWFAPAAIFALATGWLIGRQLVARRPAMEASR